MSAPLPDFHYNDVIRLLKRPGPDGPWRELYDTICDGDTYAQSRDRWGELRRSNRLQRRNRRQTVRQMQALGFISIGRTKETPAA